MPNKVLSNITSVYTDKSINGWLRGVIWVGTIGVVYIAGKAIYTKVFPPPLTIEQNTVKNIQNDIDRLSKSQKATYTSSAYDGYANTIYINQNYTTNNEYKPIYNSLIDMQNDLDVALLTKAFGIRQDYISIFPSDKVDLFTAARKGINGDLFGLYSSKIADINDNWKQKGITYKL